MIETRKCAAVLLAVFAILSGCSAAGLKLSAQLRTAAGIESGKQIKAQAWLVAPGVMRVNIEQDPPSEKTCGLSLFVKANEPGRAVLEVRCRATADKPGPGVFDTVLGEGGPTIAAYPCRLDPAKMNFEPGPDTVNNGCFVAETKNGHAFDGCFMTKGLAVASDPRGIKPSR